MSPHKVSQCQSAVRFSHKQRTAFFKACDRLSGKITIGHQTAAVSISFQGLFCKDCRIKCFCPLSGPSSHKTAQIVLPMHSDQKYSYCSGPFLPDNRLVWFTRSISSWTFFKILFQNYHSKHRSTGRYISCTDSYTIGCSHTGSGVSLWRTKRNTRLKHSAFI